MKKMRRIIVLFGALVSGLGLLFGTAGAASAANQRGLVNVNVEDVTVQVPVGVALNVCDVTVAVLAGTVLEGPTQCNADGGSIAVVPADGGGGTTNQRGLVNVNLQDVTAQVPIAIAANICDVKVPVLVTALVSGPTDCQAGAMSVAR
jgi:hypothetical protein